MEQTRVHLNLPVLIKGRNSQGKAYAERTLAENVTRRGVFIRTRQALEIGHILRIYPADDGSRAIAKAEVVWLRGQDESAGSAAGIGAKLLGSNRHWVGFLVEHSMPLEEGTEDQENEDFGTEDDD